MRKTVAVFIYFHSTYPGQIDTTWFMVDGLYSGAPSEQLENSWERLSLSLSLLDWAVVGITLYKQGFNISDFWILQGEIPLNFHTQKNINTI